MTEYHSIAGGSIIQILFDGGNGDDVLIVDASVTLPVYAVAGDGNDTITGGSGDDYISAAAGMTFLPAVRGMM